ncbi:MAG TPA: protein-glutamate O-methyltransferase CheR [Gemmatimonadaceae bacterium]|nr:protein-glutamate O-methyltransferase CheR [Gemmatimonadaceae bacterium]
MATDLQRPPDEPEERAFHALLEKIADESGFRCASYKERCLRRRIAVRMRARGVHLFGDYGRLLDADPHEWERLLDALTINVTRLFRDPAAFEALATTVVPALWRSAAPTLGVWSAGCASGEEAYSLAALFHRHAEQLGEGARATRVCVLGSDIDRGSLAAADRGCYGDAAFVDTPPALRARYFTGGDPACVVDELRAMVRFERRDLLHEPPPPGPLQLIVCRNVLIYFDRQTQEELFARFRASLAPGGFLVLGKVETLLGEARRGFTPVLPRERVFRRL